MGKPRGAETKREFPPTREEDTRCLLGKGPAVVFSFVPSRRSPEEKYLLFRVTLQGWSTSAMEMG